MYNPYMLGAVPDTLAQYRQPYMQYQQQSTDDRIFVQSKAAAEAYLVAPNSFVRLWDSNQPVFYEKRADQTGRPYMETFEYKRKASDSPQIAFNSCGGSDDQLTDINAKLGKLEQRIKVLEGVKSNEHDADDVTV